MTPPLRLFELFSGFGGASFALRKADIPFECVGFSEIDKYAVQCYEQNHQKSILDVRNCVCTEERFCNNCRHYKVKNFGDVRKIDVRSIPNFDILTGGFTCQAFSVAGKGLGEADTRGTLFHEIIRIAEAKKPRYMLLENVKGLTNKRHKDTFDKIISELKRIGYYVRWKILNSKDFGIPQNRERVFFVCKRINYVQSRWNFSWPAPEELKLFLKDILEDEVDDKYFLSETHVNRLIHSTDVPKGFSKVDPKIAGTMTARQYANWKGNFVVGNVNPSGKGMNGNVYAGDVAPTVTTNKGEGAKIIQVNNPKHSNNRIYSPEGISPTLRDMSAGGNRQPFIELKEESVRACMTPGFINKKQNGRRFKENGEPMFTLNTKDIHGLLLNNSRIRKLTPKECFRLMGFLKDEINLEGISNSQRYKLAGNGWDINLVSKIFKEMLQ